MPLLAHRCTVVAPDLPGHGFTEALQPRRLSLPGVAQAVAGLLRELDLTPELAIGHSAGAAILCRMALDATIAPARLVSLNGALLPFHGWAGVFFAPMARLLTLTPVVSMLFAWRARDPVVVRQLVDSTGSTLDARGLALYQRLLCTRAHVAGALDMMAGWDLAPLAADLPRLTVPLRLVAAERDGTVNPADAERVRARVAGASLVRLAGLGHLAHEEDPVRVLAAALD
jgi:magnesium chelatase accessory protein